MRSCRWEFVAIAALTIGASIAAQSPTPVFEAASVRPAAGGTPQSQRVLPTGVVFVNTPLRTMIYRAFRITDGAEASVPAWTTDARFDLQATYSAGATAAQVPEMLRALLQQRFGMVTHSEPRRLDGYELVVGKDGLKIQEVEPVNDLDKDFTKSGPRVSNESVSEGFDGPSRFMLLPDEIGFRTVTARSLWELRTLASGVQRIDAIRMSMPDFASLLRLNLNRPVFDRTGLTGVYQFRTELDVMTSPIPFVDRDGNPRPPTGVSTFKAVEGLGLKVQELRAPVPVLVVDKINRTPAEN